MMRLSTEDTDTSFPCLQYMYIFQEQPNKVKKTVGILSPMCLIKTARGFHLLLFPLYFILIAFLYDVVIIISEFE